MRKIGALIGTARIGVCPSVCTSMSPQQQTRAVDVGRLLQRGVRRANAGSATLSAYVGS